MTTLPAHAPSTTKRTLKADVGDFEPDEEWKKQMKQRIEDGLKSMVEEAKDKIFGPLKKAPPTPEGRKRLDEEYKQAMSNIKELANEQYLAEVIKERNQRRWLSDLPMQPGWSTIIQEEQQNIMNSFKQGDQANTSPDEEILENGFDPSTKRSRHGTLAPDNPNPNPTPSRSKSLRERTPFISKRHAPRAAVDEPSVSSLSFNSQEEDDDREFFPSQIERHRSDTLGDISPSQEEQPPTSVRQRLPNQERPAASTPWIGRDIVEEPDESPRPPRSRPAADSSSVSSSDRPWDARSTGSIRSASDRHTARSPSNNEFLRSTGPSADDVAPPKPYTQVHRRGSTASMRSTGSGASIRPTTETIPERIDDVAEEGSSNRDGGLQHERSRKSADKAREKEKRPHGRRDSRPTPVDPALRHDESLGLPSGMRSAGSSSATMQYATSNSPVHSLSKKPSSASVEERYLPTDRPHSYLEPHDNHLLPRDSYSHREPYSPRDPPPSATRPPRSPYNPDERDYTPSPRPMPPRSPYNGDERDYGPRDIPPIRPSVPRPPYGVDERDYPGSRDIPNSASHPLPPRVPYGDDRDYNGVYLPANGRHNGSKGSFMNDRDYPAGPHPPISHKGSFNYDDQRRRDAWEREREPVWHDDRDHRDRDRDYNREPRERDRDMYPPDPRQPPHLHYAQRNATYPTPPSSAHRHASQDYHQGDIYDDRDPTSPAPRGYPYRGHQEDEYEYGRPTSTRPNVPTRQHSYTRRDTPDRRLDNDPESYSRPYAHPLPDVVPRSASTSHHAPSSEHVERPIPAWKEWASEGARAHPDSRHDPHSRSLTADQHYVDRHAKSQSHRIYPPSDSESGRYDTEPDDPSESDEGSHGPNSYSRSQSETDEGDEADEEDDNSDTQARRKMYEGSRSIKIQSRELKRLQEEERRAEEEAQKKENDMRRKEEEVRRKEEETKRKEDELRLKAEEAQRKQEEARLKEEEARLREEEAERRAEEARQKEEDLRKKEEEAQRLEEEARRKEQLAAKKEAEAKKKEQDAKKKEKEVHKREQVAAKKAEAAKQMEAEAGRKAEEAQRKEADLKKKEEETLQKEERLKQDAEKTKALQEQAEKIANDAREKQEMLRQLEEETKRREAEIRERESALLVREEELKRREADARKKEEEARRLEREAREKEAEAKRKEVAEAKRKEQEAEARRKEQEAEARRKEQEAEARRKEQEAEARRKEQEAEAKRKEDATRQARMAEETSRRDDARMSDESDPIVLDDEMLKNLDPKIVEEQAYILQQFKYRQQAETIRRNRAEQRIRNDSIGHESTWLPPYTSASPGASSSNPRPSSQSSQPPQSAQYNGAPPADRNSSTSSWSTGSPTWTSSPKTATSPASSNPRTPTGTFPNTNKPTTSVPLQAKPRAESANSSSYPAGASPHAGPGISEAEWARRQTEFHQSQQEKFRREQEKIEADIQMRSAGKPLTREDMVRVLERHDKLWSNLSQKSELTWSDFPWPMARPPLVPDDISAPMISAYMQSPCWPDKERTRTPKDRIKEHMKRWHPDRFETKLLPKVVEAQKETVKHGAGNVARYLSDLLRKENENNSSSTLFGD